METARVDIRKLQLLNDRINQCLDALNQVRLTVHGLSHTGLQSGLQSGAQSGLPSGLQTGVGSQTPFVQMGGIGAIDPRFAQAAQAQGIQGFIGTQGYGAGLSHTPFTPFVQQPFAQSAYGLPVAGFPSNVPSFPQWGQQGGLGHTDFEGIYNRSVWADPMIASRVKETFPFVGYALPPVVSLY
jgi:hypothetical protein